MGVCGRLLRYATAGYDVRWLSRALARTEATVVGYDHTGCFDTPLRAMIFRWLSRALACIEATVVGYDHTGCFDTPYRATQQPTLFGG